ncbi:MAG: ribonuclease HII [Rhodobacteraceae bacterium]|nr:ribonuclease HII [Paracoccaceae bacterium]
MSKTLPSYAHEKSAHAKGFSVVCGVDEVGRGPLAGPVVAAAVVLDPAHIPIGLNDSKKLSAKRRAVLEEQIMEHAVYCVAEASVAEIDEINILWASMLAMQRAVAGLKLAPDMALIDGNRIPPDLPCKALPLIGGDAISVSIAAASIMAKQRRDRIMVGLAQQHPGYGWEKNAGYPVKAHREALKILGVTPHHRRSFKPVHNILYQEKLLTR